MAVPDITRRDNVRPLLAGSVVRLTLSRLTQLTIQKICWPEFFECAYFMFMDAN